MPNRDMIAVIQHTAEVLSPAMWAAHGTALHDADSRLRGLKHETYPALRPLVARASLREFLMADEVLPPGWRVAGRPQQMGQLIIESGDVTARFLKESPTVFPGGVPAAGRNGARQAFWQPSLLEVDSPMHQLNLLLLWDYNTPGRAEDGFSLRLVHPKGQGRYQGHTPIDASIPLSDDLNLFKSLRFTDAQRDAQEDFFAEIDADEAGGQGHGFAG